MWGGVFARGPVVVGVPGEKGLRRALGCRVGVRVIQGPTCSPWSSGDRAGDASHTRRTYRDGVAPIPLTPLDSIPPSPGVH